MSLWLDCPHCRLRFCLGAAPEVCKFLQCTECACSFWAHDVAVPNKGGVRGEIGITPHQALKFWRPEAIH